jgi:hypothetical protein
MNEQELHEGLERVSHNAPQVDASGMARRVTALTVRSRRRGYALAVPTAAAAVAVVVVATGAALPSGTGKTGRAAALAQPASRAAEASPIAANPSATAPTPSTAPASAANPNAAPPSTGGQGNTAGRNAIAYGFVGPWTCCDDADRAEQVKPGGTFLAHFRAGLAGNSTAVTVTVTLTGPFADARTMMSDPAPPASSRYASTPLNLPSRASGVKVATVPIPETAKAGLYLISIAHGGSSGSAGSVLITR